MADLESPRPADNPPAGLSSKDRLAALFVFLRSRRRPILLGGGALLFVFVIVPWAFHVFRTVSTDDAYVNSHVTFVAPRVSGQVVHVLVEDNNRVRKGDVLLELDPEPYRVQVAIKEAAVNTARANLVVAEATTRSQIGQTRGLRFKLQHAIEDVDNQIAILRARVATWESTKATQVLAQAEFDRAKKLLETKVSSREEYDKKR
jgi:membrane fusion protein (multidrug efflux system)